MILKAYSIYDRAARAYAQPFFAPSDGVAVRMVDATARDPSTNLARYPQDYMLYWVGSFDDQEGMFTRGDPVQIASVVGLLSEEQGDRSNDERVNVEETK